MYKLLCLKKSAIVQSFKKIISLFSGNTKKDRATAFLSISPCYAE